MASLAPPTRPDPAERTWRSNAYAMAAGCMCSSLGFTCSWPFIPIILQDLGITRHLAAWVGGLVGSFFVMSFLLTPVWGGLADHFGKRTLMVRAGFGMGAGFAVLPLAPNVWAILAIFLVIGAANGYIPGALAMTASTTPARYIGRALAIVQMGGLVGTACGPALGALMLSLVPRGLDVFWASAALTLLAGLVALLFTREEVPPRPGRFQFTVLRDVGACLRVRGMPLLYGANSLFAMTYMGSATVVSLFVLSLMSAAPSYLGRGAAFWIGSATLAMTLSSIAAAYGWGRLLDRYRVPHVLALALLTAFAGSLALPLVGNPLQLTLVRALIGALMVGMQPAVLRLVKEHAPPGMEARALGYAAAVQMIGNGSASVLAGALAPLVGLRGYFILNSALLLGMLAAWVLRGPGVALTWRRMGGVPGGEGP
jgi:DHA1 family multidrug resistance protein-like MFS transporter